MADIYLDRYESLGLLGQGGMGKVYLARSLTHPDQIVVVKVMHERIAAQPRFLELFRREIQSLRKLVHPYIVRMVDSSLNDPHGPCLVMEYIPGSTLEAVLRKEKRFSVGRVGLLLGYLCRALETAHAKGIIHRDLKPANIMLLNVGTENETLRVMDFGLATRSVRPHFSAERLAGDDTIMAHGTATYICPEQLRGDELEPRSDLYSVGIMLYEMLTGRLPFESPSLDQLFQDHLTKHPAPMSRAGISGIPAAVELVVQMALSKYPVERPGSARNFADRYSEAIGIDIWAATEPPEEVGEVDELSVTSGVSHFGGSRMDDLDPNTIRHNIEAWMPERIAVVKLRGFLEDAGGTVLKSEPGVLRVRIGEIEKAGFMGGTLKALGWKKSKPDPIDIDLYLIKPDAASNRLQITVMFRPPAEVELRAPEEWRGRCQVLYNELQAYFLAQR